MKKGKKKRELDKQERIIGGSTPIPIKSPLLVNVPKPHFTL
jgi:hypothetical protein